MSEPSEPTLESLRAEGAHHYDPARFHYLEVLARRLPGQHAAVQLFGPILSQFQKIQILPRRQTVPDQPVSHEIDRIQQHQPGQSRPLLQ